MDWQKLLEELLESPEDKMQRIGNELFDFMGNWETLILSEEGKQEIREFLSRIVKELSE